MTPRSVKLFMDACDAKAPANVLDAILADMRLEYEAIRRARLIAKAAKRLAFRAAHTGTTALTIRQLKAAERALENL